jgi:predicted porin
MGTRIGLKAGHVAQLGGELQIVGQLELPEAVRLQSV